jgi:hypothetical protein
MEDDWWPDYDFDSNELSYGIPTDSKNIPLLAKRILNSSFVDSSQGFDLQILLDVEQIEEVWGEEPDIEQKISSIIEALRERIKSLLEEAESRFDFESDMSEWDEGYCVVVEFTENKTELIECIRFLITQVDLFEYCTLGLSFYLVPVSQLYGDPEFTTMCEEIEQRTRGEFSIRGKAELGPYDGIQGGSSFYQTFLLMSPLYEFPLQFFRGHSEDNRLASSYYYYIFSKICKAIDCKLTLLKA